jgi:hypothetical protein
MYDRTQFFLADITPRDHLHKIDVKNVGEYVVANLYRTS